MIGAELQTAVFAALTGAGVAGGRIYDRPPDSVVFPYITIGDSQVIDDGGSDGDGCVGGWEVFEDIHVWSRPNSGSKGELKSLVAQIVPALVALAEVNGHDVVAAGLETVRTFRDRDGITEHAVVTVRYLINPAT